MQTPQGKSIIGMGLFGVQGREHKKILAKQILLFKSNDPVQFIQTLKKSYDCFGLDRDEDFVDLLWGMLDFNPIRRMSPDEILDHPFLHSVKP